MVGYGQFCPVAKTSELLCERWVPLIVREFLTGSRRFSEVHRGVPLISPTLLSKRLRQLEAAGVLERSGPERTAAYVLTEAGWELYPIIEEMGKWGQRWARSTYGRDELDPSLLMWDIRKMVQPAGLADERTVVEFRFTRAPAGKKRFWMVVDDAIDLCLIDPGYPIDLVAAADLRALTKVWMGDTTWRAAIDAGSITLDGRRSLVRRFPAWMGQHPVLAAVGPARHR